MKTFDFANKLEAVQVLLAYLFNDMSDALEEAGIDVDSDVTCTLYNRHSVLRALCFTFNVICYGIPHTPGGQGKDFVVDQG